MDYEHVRDVDPDVADAVCDRLATHYPAVQRSETA